MGATKSEVLSPTPPVECLSTANFLSGEGSKVSPEKRIALVSASSSARESPRRKAAISQAASCSSGTKLRAAPSARKRISSAESSSPSRFLRIRSTACIGLPVRKAVRQQFGKRNGSHTTLTVCEINQGILCEELAQHLPACSAGWAGSTFKICNCNGGDFAFQTGFCNGADNSRTFGTNRQAIGDVLDVASSDDGAIAQKQCRAYSKAGIRRIGMFCSGGGGFTQLLQLFRCKLRHRFLRLPGERAGVQLQRFARYHHLYEAIPRAAMTKVTSIRKKLLAVCPVFALFHNVPRGTFLLQHVQPMRARCSSFFFFSR